MKLNCGKPLSNFAVNFKLRRCSEAAARGQVEVLIWARELGLPWEKDQPDESYTEFSARATANGDNRLESHPAFKQGDHAPIHCCALAA